MRRVEREVVTDEPAVLHERTTVRRAGAGSQTVLAAVLAAGLIIFIIWLVATFLA